jgi:hypothetical protein
MSSDGNSSQVTIRRKPEIERQNTLYGVLIDPNCMPNSVNFRAQAAHVLTEGSDGYAQEGYALIRSDITPSLAG